MPMTPSLPWGGDLQSPLDKRGRPTPLPPFSMGGGDLHSQSNKLGRPPPLPPFSMGEETYPPKGRRSPSQPATLIFPSKRVELPSLPSKEEDTSLPSKG